MIEKGIFQIVGYKNTGKTTLICTLIKGLVQQGLRVGTIKHDGHEFEIDHPGTDTWRHREAGASAVSITSKTSTVVIEEQHTPLDVLIKRFHDVDLILVEGFKNEIYPKLALVKSFDELGSMIHLDNLRGIVTWEPVESSNFLEERNIPCYWINDHQQLLHVVLQECAAGKAGQDEPVAIADEEITLRQG